MGISIWHILVVALVVFLLFGAGRVPRMMEDLAKGIKSFKRGLSDDETQPSKPSEPKRIADMSAEERAAAERQKDDQMRG